MVSIIGKTSKDSLISLHLNERNLVSTEGLRGVLTVRVANDKTVLLGIIGRLVMDHGMGIGEYIVYQNAVTVPAVHDSKEACLEGTLSGLEGAIDTGNSCKFQLVRDLNASTVDRTLLFQVDMPEELPPSALLATRRCAPGWGMNWYIVAFTVNDRISHPRGALWDKLRISAQSKVIIAFTRRAVGSIERPLLAIGGSQPPGSMGDLSDSGISRGKRKGFLLGGPKITMQVLMDKTRYTYGEPMTFDVSLQMPNNTTWSPTIRSLRMTFKQKVTVQYLGKACLIQKHCWYVSEFKTAGGLKMRHLSKEGGATINDAFRCDPKLDTSSIPYHMALFVPLSNYKFAPMKSPNTGSLTRPAPSIEYQNTHAGFNTIAKGSTSMLKIMKVEYYVNVHAVFPFWHPDLIVQCPFELKIPDLPEELHPSLLRNQSMPSLNQGKSQRPHPRIEQDASQAISEDTKQLLLIDFDDPGTEDDNLDQFQDKASRSKGEKSDTGAFIIDIDALVEEMKSVKPTGNVNNSQHQSEGIIMELMVQAGLIIDGMSRLDLLIDALTMFARLFPSVDSLQFMQLVDTLILLVKSTGASTWDASSKKHQKLTPRQRELTRIVKDALVTLMLPSVELLALNLALIGAFEEAADDGLGNEEATALKVSSLLDPFQRVQEETTWRSLVEYVDALSEARSVLGVNALFWHQEYLIILFKRTLKSQQVSLILFLMYEWNKEEAKGSTTGKSQIEKRVSVPSFYQLMEDGEQKESFVKQQLIEEMARL